MSEEQKKNSNPDQQPPSLQQIISLGRSEYIAQQTQIYDRIVEPYIIMITKLAEQLQAATPPNRAERRKAQRRQKKAKTTPVRPT